MRVICSVYSEYVCRTEDTIGCFVQMIARITYICTELHFVGDFNKIN